jgi:hypothetical protein
MPSLDISKVNFFSGESSLASTLLEVCPTFRQILIKLQLRRFVLLLVITDSSEFEGGLMGDALYILDCDGQVQAVLFGF